MPVLLRKIDKIFPTLCLLWAEIEVVKMRGLITLAVIIGTLAFVAGVCYEIGSFWTWQALRYLWGV